MNVSDYKKESRDCWIAKSRVETKMGPLAIRLSGVLKGQQPSGEMVQRADQLIEFALATIDALHDKVFKEYPGRTRTAQTKEWLASCGVPLNLDRAGFLKYVEDLTLTVDYNPNSAELYTCYFSATPAWDEEHGLCFYPHDGKWLTDDQWRRIPPARSASRSLYKQLYVAIAAGRKAEIQELLARGVSINDVPRGELLPLHAAISDCKPLVVRRLLQYGANPAMKDPDWKTTPLQHAKELYRNYSVYGTGPGYRALAKKFGQIVEILESASRK